MGTKLLKNLLVLACLLIVGVPALALDPGHFIVLDMPGFRQMERWGCIPGHAMSEEELWEIAEFKFNGDTLRVLAVLVEWDDRPGFHSRESFDSLLFSRDELPEGSFADYIWEVSYGELEIDGDVLDWFNAGPVFDKNYDFGELFPLLDPIVDFSQYDGDGDKKVDAVCFIRSGTGEEDSQDPIDIWSFAAVSDFGWGHYDGVKISQWNTCPETKPLRNPVYPLEFSGETIRSGIRVYTHELGHNMGLPDLYDYDDKLVTSTYNNPNDYNNHPLVDWDPMGYYGYGYMSVGMIAPNHYCGWCKMALGFIEPVVLSGEIEDLVIYDVETHSDSSLYQIFIKGSNTEYFLLEFRNPHSTAKFDKLDSDFSTWFWPDLTFGYDEMDCGLLICHIDDSVVPESEWFGTNRGTPRYPHYTVMVEDAGYNPNKDVTYNPEGHVTDSAQWWYPWETRKGALFSSEVPGQNIFGPNTVPGSDGYTGYSGIYVRVDSIVGDKLYAYVNTDLAWLECCVNRGDANRSGSVDPLDAVFLLNYFFKGGPAADCEEEADADDNNSVDPLDLVYLINYLFQGGPAPAECPAGGVPPTFTSTPVTTATYGQLYSYDANASGDPVPEYELALGPAGMTINTVTGLVEWTPDDVGDYDVIIDAVNFAGSDTQPYTITVSGTTPVITTSPGLSAVVGQLYSYDADADGYPAPTFSLTTAPVGMTVDPATGLIEWTPTDETDADVVLEATNAYGTDIQSFTISVSGFAPTFTSTPITSGVVGQLYTYDADADGYPAPTYSLTTYPAGMTIDPETGVIQWTPDTADDFDVVVEAANSYGTDVQSFTVSVASAPEAPVITSTPITTATVDVLYTYDVEATGHPDPTFALTEAPSQMDIDPVTGVIEWTPSSTGDVDVIVEATNASGTDYQSFTISVGGIPPTFTSTPPTTATYDVQYTYDANADGDPDPTFALITAPTGMTINSGTGYVRWTPADIGDFDVVIEATNSAGSAQQPFTITVSGVAPSFTSTPVTTGTYGVLYTYDANASGYPAATYSLTTYPTGMTIDPVTGVIQWTPDDVGDFSVVVEATNTEGTATQPFTITVSGVAPSFTSTPVTTGTVDVLYSYDADADGYPAATYSLTTYPTGMTIDPVSGVIQWTPTVADDYDVTVEATNSYGNDVQNFTITVSPPPEAPTITSTPITTVTVDDPYTYDVEATGYPAPTFDLTTAPQGMTIDEVSGLIEWTPSSVGDYDVVVEASNASGTDTQPFTITVNGIPPTFTSTPITTATYDVQYTYDANASGEPNPTFALTTAPAGMTINSGTGVIRWTPDDIGDYDVVVEATNSAGSATQPFTITVSGVAPSFTSTPVTTGTYNVLYTYDADADGYPAATFSLTTYPTGMTIDPVTGVIQWTPGDIGDYDVVVEATNSLGTATQPFTITVSGVAPSFTSTPVTTGTVSVLYTYDADADGYPAATFSLTTYPTGMTIEPATGVIQWTPDSSGDFNVVVEATNSAGSTTQPYTISVSE